jgi:hypothetical protein
LLWGERRVIGSLSAARRFPYEVHRPGELQLKHSGTGQNSGNRAIDSDPRRKSCSGGRKH